MKYLKLHSKTAAVVYKNSLCSVSTIIVSILSLLSVILPILLVNLLSPYSGVVENRILYEQPRLEFQFKYLFLGEKADGDLIACSSFNYFNDATHEFHRCNQIKFVETDWNYDFLADHAKIQLKIDSTGDNLLQHFYIFLFFEATLTKKCNLKPPAVLVQHLEIPSRASLSTQIVLNGKLSLVQNSEFLCPFYGRHTKSHFHNNIIASNTSNLDFFDIRRIQDEIKENPGYFKIDSEEIYYEQQSQNGIKIEINMDIPQIAVRYHLNVWERLGQFWLYFASFFGISFLIVNRIKDFLFSRHILRSWEIIPWKKMY